MTELHRTADKLTEETEHLRRAIQRGDTNLALSIAKRVRRQSTLVVRLLAANRDQRQS